MACRSGGWRETCAGSYRRGPEPFSGPNPLPLAVLVGAEGGFAAAERAALLRLPHVVRLGLGPRILRADTAAVAALALVQSVLGDWALTAVDRSAAAPLGAAE